VLTEAYPESEFNMNPTGGAAGDALAGGGLRCGAQHSGGCASLLLALLRR